MAKTCPQCNTENPSKATHCMKCGALLVEEKLLSEEEMLQRKLKKEQEEKELLKAALEAMQKSNAETKETERQVTIEAKKPVPSEPEPHKNVVVDTQKPLPSPKKKMVLMASAAAVIVLVIVLLAVILPNKEDLRTYNGKNAFDYLLEADSLAKSSDYLSLNSAWESFLIADSLQDGNADVDVLINIMYRANSLFNEKVNSQNLNEEETEMAGMLIKLSREIYDTKHDAIMAKIESDTSSINFSYCSVEYYRSQYDTLSNLYIKQAKSAITLVELYPDNKNEIGLLKKSIEKALFFNPDNKTALEYQEKYCNK